MKPVNLMLDLKFVIIIWLYCKIFELKILTLTDNREIMYNYQENFIIMTKLNSLKNQFLF